MRIIQWVSVSGQHDQRGSHGVCHISVDTERALSTRQHPTPLFTVNTARQYLLHQLLGDAERLWCVLAAACLRGGPARVVAAVCP